MTAPWDKPEHPLAETNPEIVETFPILHQPEEGLEAPKLNSRVAELLKKNLNSTIKEN
jgi:hypothetical protein